MKNLSNLKSVKVLSISQKKQIKGSGGDCPTSCFGKEYGTRCWAGGGAYGCYGIGICTNWGCQYY